MKIFQPGLVFEGGDNLYISIPKHLCRIMNCAPEEMASTPVWVYYLDYNSIQDRRLRDNLPIINEENTKHHFLPLATHKQLLALPYTSDSGNMNNCYRIQMYMDDKPFTLFALFWLLGDVFNMKITYTYGVDAIETHGYIECFVEFKDFPYFDIPARHLEQMINGVALKLAKKYFHELKHGEPVVEGKHPYGFSSEEMEKIFLYHTQSHSRFFSNISDRMKKAHVNWCNACEHIRKGYKKGPKYYKSAKISPAPPYFFSVDTPDTLPRSITEELMTFPWRQFGSDIIQIGNQLRSEIRMPSIRVRVLEAFPPKTARLIKNHEPVQCEIVKKENDNDNINYNLSEYYFLKISDDGRKKLGLPFDNFNIKTILHEILRSPEFKIEDKVTDRIITEFLEKNQGAVCFETDQWKEVLGGVLKKFGFEDNVFEKIIADFKAKISKDKSSIKTDLCKILRSPEFKIEDIFINKIIKDFRGKIQDSVYFETDEWKEVLGRLLKLSEVEDDVIEKIIADFKAKISKDKSSIETDLCKILSSPKFKIEDKDVERIARDFLKIPNRVTQSYFSNNKWEDVLDGILKLSEFSDVEITNIKKGFKEKISKDDKLGSYAPWFLPNRYIDRCFAIVGLDERSDSIGVHFKPSYEQLLHLELEVGNEISSPMGFTDITHELSKLGFDMRIMSHRQLCKDNSIFENIDLYADISETSLGYFGVEEIKYILSKKLNNVNDNPILPTSQGICIENGEEINITNKNTESVKVKKCQWALDKQPKLPTIKVECACCFRERPENCNNKDECVDDLIEKLKEIRFPQKDKSFKSADAKIFIKKDKIFCCAILYTPASKKSAQLFRCVCISRTSDSEIKKMYGDLKNQRKYFDNWVNEFQNTEKNDSAFTRELEHRQGYRDPICRQPFVIKAIELACSIEVDFENLEQAKKKAKEQARKLLSDNYLYCKPIEFDVPVDISVITMKENPDKIFEIVEDDKSDPLELKYIENIGHGANGDVIKVELLLDQWGLNPNGKIKDTVQKASNNAKSFKVFWEQMAKFNRYLKRDENDNIIENLVLKSPRQHALIEAGRKNFLNNSETSIAPPTLWIKETGSLQRQAVLMPYLGGADCDEFFKLAQTNEKLYTKDPGPNFDDILTVLYKASNIINEMVNNPNYPCAHLDIKPPNIFCVKRCEIRFIDLGLVFSLEGIEETSSEKYVDKDVVQYLQENFWVFGSPYHIPPELRYDYVSKETKKDNKRKSDVTAKAMVYQWGTLACSLLGDKLYSECKEHHEKGYCPKDIESIDYNNHNKKQNVQNDSNYLNALKKQLPCSWFDALKIHPDETVRETYFSVFNLKHDKKPKPPEWVAKYNPILYELINKCLSSNPKERPLSETLSKTVGEIFYPNNHNGETINEAAETSDINKNIDRTKNLVLPFLEVIDNLERASNVMETSTFTSLQEGVNMTLNLFRSRLLDINLDPSQKLSKKQINKDALPFLEVYNKLALAKAAKTTANEKMVRDIVSEALALFRLKLRDIGVQEIALLNKPFDANLAEAIDVVTVTEPNENGIVIKVHRSGYTIKGFHYPLRYAQVIVGEYRK